jgi:hypothetical protein
MGIYEKIVEKIKLRLIVWIDNKYPEACWANLVTWQDGGYTFKEMFGYKSRWNEQDCSEEHGGAYCGKCIRTGRLKW